MHTGNSAFGANTELFCQYFVRGTTFLCKVRDGSCCKLRLIPKAGHYIDMSHCNQWGLFPYCARFDPFNLRYPWESLA